MGIILIFRVTANVVQQAEIDQDLLVLFRKGHSRMLTVNEGQKQYPQDVFDPVVHEKAFLGIAQGDCDGAIPEEILCNWCQEPGHMALG